MMTITICPSCSGKNIQRRKQEWVGEYRGRRFTVPDLEFYECPDCGEKVYDAEAMRKIEACSPAFEAINV
jgi:YgiT-type zinc finger domain-containing protein